MHMQPAVLHPCTTHSAPSCKCCYCLPLTPYMIPLLTLVRQCLRVLWSVGMLLWIQGWVSWHPILQMVVSLIIITAKQEWAMIISLQPYSVSNTQIPIQSFTHYCHFLQLVDIFGHWPLLPMSSSCWPLLFFLLTENKSTITMTHTYNSKLCNSPIVILHFTHLLISIGCSTLQKK